jgi:hypothetical protein
VDWLGYNRAWWWVGAGVVAAGFFVYSGGLAGAFVLSLSVHYHLLSMPLKQKPEPEPKPKPKTPTPSKPPEPPGDGNGNGGGNDDGEQGSGGEQPLPSIPELTPVGLFAIGLIILTGYVRLNRRKAK